MVKLKTPALLIAALGKSKGRMEARRRNLDREFRRSNLGNAGPPRVFEVLSEGRPRRLRRSSPG